MASFSSVAYEDPPNAKQGMAQVEKIIDNYGVTITRPSVDYKIAQNTDRVNNEGVENVWDMAHVNAMSPRPLMPMFSECNMSGMSSNNDINNALTMSQFQWVALATNKQTSAQFDVWRITSTTEELQKNKDILVIAFRGTRLSSYSDLLTDIQLQQDMISCSDLGVCMCEGDAKEEMTDGSKTDGLHNNKPPASSSSSIMAHSGFLKAYSSIRPTLLQLLSDNANTYDQIWFTGHSLGAALATLAVVDVGSLMNDSSNPITIKPKIASFPLEQKLNLPKVVSISSYLFGTPRVGNREFSDRLARLQNRPGSVIQEYYRINTPGDAVVFLPRGKAANRLGIDYVHAGASVFLPALSTENEGEVGGGESEQKISDDLPNDGSKTSLSRQSKTKGSYSQWMMQLEEDTIERINKRIFQSEGRGTAKIGTADTTKTSNISSKIRIYPKGDQPPDPLSEVDPQYTGFFPMDPRTWISSKSFQNFLLGETVRSFRILRGGFVKNHKLKTYEDALCLASQDNVLLINPLEQ